MQFLTGAITPASAQFAVIGLDMEAQIKSYKEGTAVSGQFNDAYKKSADTFLEGADIALAHSEGLREISGQNEKTLSYQNKRFDVVSETAAAEDARKKLEANTVGEGIAAQDAAQISRNELTEIERKAKIGLDDLVASVNPLMQGFNATTIAATALTAAAGVAAIALGGMAAKSMAGKAIEAAAGTGSSGAGKGGGFKSVAGGLLKGGVAALGGMALTKGGEYAKEQGHAKTGAGLDIAGTTASYAGTGAMIGSVIPGFGTAVGAGMGAAVGFGKGLYDNRETVFGMKSPAAPVAAPVAMGNEGRRGTPPAPSAPNPTSASQLADAGLTLKKGDVQGEGKHLDPRLIEIAKQVQAQVPGFMQFTGFNDQFHNEKAPSSMHTKGNAFDFTISPQPTKEKGAEIVAMLKGLGLDFALDEYNNASAKATGGHFHGQLKAYDGGVFEGPTAGYNVELHGREAIVPLPDPNSMISVSDEGATKEPLASAMSKSSSGSLPGVDQLAGITQAMMQMMEYKFDEMISKLSDGNDIQTELLQYSKA
jgi:hypothetical protein